MAKFDDGQPRAQVVLAGLESTFGDLVNYDHHRLQGEYYATAYGNIDPSLFNPFVHAYVSAALTRDYGFAIAMSYGNAREQRTTAEYYFAFGEDYRKDTYRDLFNNHVGALIGNYADDHELNDGQVAALVQDALDAGELITDIIAPSYKSPTTCQSQSRPTSFIRACRWKCSSVPASARSWST
jgi:hypothetical protein